MGHKMNHIQKYLTKLRSCDPATKWAGTQNDYKSAYANCPDGSWLLWLLAELGFDPIQRRILGAWCARNTPLGDGRTAWDLMVDERSRHAIEVAEDPDATIAQLFAANTAATAAAAASAAYATAATAAYYAAVPENVAGDHRRG